MTTPRFVAYYRVSTAKQGRSGLGLEAQRRDVEACVGRVGGEVIAEFQDIESGKVDDRPQLQRALALCRVTRAQLIVAKLDRLSRDLAFIAQLQKAELTSFIAADMPEAGEFQTHAMAMFAQLERSMISKRTKAALASAKARGTKLGNPANLSNQLGGSLAGNKKKTEKAEAYARDMATYVDEAREQGAMTLRQIASYLNARCIRTPRDGKWSAVQVARIITRTQPDRT